MDPMPKRDRDIGNSSYQAPAKRVQIQTQARPHLHVAVQHRPARVPAVQHQRQQGVTYIFCHRPGHHVVVCRKRLGLCLFCGLDAHQMRGCQQATARLAGGPRGAGVPPPAPPRALPATPQRGGALPPQQQRFAQHQQQ
ncbi:uncharacterized protein M6B38_343260 [Iris pallida]|uniref:CCHC-type domain-containing protein n=1 Tax=Iris pallida TaxID=29817 RepID=A0AAX6GVT5_IRIPA|nr:uncharacterized protein M6B38_398235 [Iris pallida]KAJ6832604.1 uncharacterized protein M6B38_343260 [Iris pallida]